MKNVRYKILLIWYICGFLTLLMWGSMYFRSKKPVPPVRFIGGKAVVSVYIDNHMYLIIAYTNSARIYHSSSCVCLQGK